MVNALLIVLVVLAIVVVTLLAIASTKPDIFRVRRTARINASPQTIYALINDFHHWQEWSPWEKLDPALKRLYSGAPSGTGAVYDWDGNKKVGQGRMEIVESVPYSKITIKLDFLRPFEAHNRVDFSLIPVGGETEIIWDMHGPNTFVTKIMHTVMNMDRMVGKDFEAGLANLRTAAEK